VGGLTALMLLLWLGFLLHRSPRFPGSLEGSLLGIAAALLMVVPLAYSVAKRVRFVRSRVTARISLRTFLAWHIYAGVLGPILGLLHTGHRFASPLGIALTATMLVVALSGFVGRYLLRMIAEEARERRSLRDSLREEYERIAVSLRTAPDQAALLTAFTGSLSGWVGRLFLTRDDDTGTARSPALRAIRISEALSDVEHALQTQETFKRWFSRWLRLHIVLTVVLYLLLALHIAAGLYLGLRWL
jgi:hypothetical protein